MDTKVCNKCSVEKNICEFRKISEKNNRYVSYCFPCEKKYKQEHYQKNKEEHLRKKQKWRQENPEEYKEQIRRYYLKTKDIQLVKKKKWISENREKYNSYWTERKKNDEVFRLITNMRSRLWAYLKYMKVTKKNKTFDIVGCTPEYLKEHLEKQFVNGMTWENRDEWHIDHIIPLSSATSEEEALKLYHYTNLQPLWAIDNLRKSNKIISQ
jgi:hypothetical protein